MNAGAELDRYDVLVVGAGAAGLIAAKKLSDAGKSAFVVEARARIGGRTFTQTVPGIATPIELGAEFVHGRPAVTFELLRAAGTSAVDTGGGRMVFRDGALSAAAVNQFEMAREIVHRVDRLPPGEDLSVEDFLARFAGDPAEREASAAVRTMVEGFDAADPSQAGIRAIAQEWNGDAVMRQNSRPSGGYASLIGWLTAALDPERVRLATRAVVAELNWSPDGIEANGTIDGEPLRVQARRAIVTVPAGVLALPEGEEGAIRFTPPLPEPKREAIDRIAMGPVVKIVLKFRTAFWEMIGDGAYQDAGFFQDRRQPFPAFWTQFPERVPLLAGWAGGPRAAALTGSGDDAIVRAALDSLQGVFGEAVAIRRELEAYWLCDWAREPFSRGGYSYVLVGGIGAREALGAPLEASLFFAGEATARIEEAGTVAGALESGIRAANEVLAARS